MKRVHLRERAWLEGWAQGSLVHDVDFFLEADEMDPWGEEP